MTRRQLFSICSSARTHAEIRAAWEARASYLGDHPDDDEAIQIGASLSRYEEALDLLGRDYGPAPLSAVEVDEVVRAS
jgi:hypothetical protein